MRGLVYLGVLRDMRYTASEWLEGFLLLKAKTVEDIDFLMCLLGEEEAKKK